MVLSLDSHSRPLLACLLRVYSVKFLYLCIGSADLKMTAGLFPGRFVFDVWFAFGDYTIHIVLPEPVARRFKRGPVLRQQPIGLV